MSDSKPAFLSIENISLGYDKTAIVHDVHFQLNEGDLGCLLGPSGCGKTTILRAISGFQPLLSGSIHLDGQIISSVDSLLAPDKRNVGMVFQDHALFPHLSISQNIAFGLQHLNKSEQQERVDSLLDLVGMYDYREQYPHQLSGGQSQRVSLARAIAPQPKLLLMDEPFSNLDTELRESLGYEVHSLLKRLNITAMMVTHDQHDAFALGDKIGVMSKGQLMQWDSSFNLYHAPKNRFVASFVGDGVFVKGNMIEENTVRTNFADICGKPVNTNTIGKQVDLLIRPDDVKHDNNGPIKATITRKAFKGAETLYRLITESNDELLSLLPSHDDFAIGDKIGLRIDAEHLVCFTA